MLKPSLEPESVVALMKSLATSKTFLEYGSGGSTFLAEKCGVNNIISIESDYDFSEKVKNEYSALNSSVILNLLYADIGPTEAWGHPIDKNYSFKWPGYALLPWEFLSKTNISPPDHILIDGRFRVACFISSLSLSPPGTCIFFDDYLNRSYYHCVEKYLKPVATFGRMALFITPSEPIKTNLLPDFFKAAHNPQ